MRLSTHFPAFTVMLGAALMCVAVALLAVAQIERNSLGAVKRALVMEGQGWARVSVDGLIVTLTGTAPDEATRFKALKLAGSRVDDSRVVDEMDVAAAAEIAPPRFSIEILRNDAGVSLIGLVPAAMDRDAMANIVARIARGAQVTDLLESADYPVPGGWAPALDFALDVLGALPRSKISVAAGRVEITSVSESAAAKRALELDLADEKPEGVDLVLNISAPRPVISPFTLRFVSDEGGVRFDACSAHTEAGRAQILAAAAAAGLTGTAPCVLGLGVPSPRWADAVTAGIEAVAALDGGTVTYSDADISLLAPDTVAPEQFDRVVGSLEAKLPDVFSLSAVRPEPVSVDGSGTDRPDGPPEFVATLSPEGVLLLRGRVSDTRQRDAVTGVAQVHFAGAELGSSLRVDEQLPNGWAKRVFAGMQALTQLSYGALVVQPNFIDIRGDTGNQNAKAEIARILSAELGELANYAIDVTYHEKLDPLASIPTPEECVAQINEILTTKKVTFEPGSADIDSEGAGPIEKIAEVLKLCADVPMEIAGYTDSQGRESMNLKLSQERADAVLAALRERRVLTANLTPKGYGEENPIADNGTEAGREANRRIEFTLIVPEVAEATATEEEAPSEDGAQTE